ncbi:Peptidyl-glycine alpha-amidating monooxygenase A [Schistosoma japonicum]|uniref:Peptidyl-glycine alpha-amidating monooxygenase A n=1 Tax=Schistosoma japonicum TaxID=6182 RepID=A0A4Z2CVA9_SCHJA|nr:Peptidyl-glycine alpha-amidating monooxygenase A [Schistosoma japonicum]
MFYFPRIDFLFCCLLNICEAYRVWEQELKMPFVNIEHADTYMCRQFQPLLQNETTFIREILPSANRSTVHHIILKGCSYPVKATDKPTQCGMCETILYAWGMDAPALRFPLGVGYPAGLNSPIKGFELEVHYLNPTKSDHSGLNLVVTDQIQPRIAGIFLLFSSDATIPPGEKNYAIDVSCRISSTMPVTLMAIRGHAHSMGRSIIGYRLPHGRGPAQLLGRANPQLPQAFYPLKQLDSEFDAVEVGENDIIMARCVYDSTSKTHNVGMGPTHDDEMCNLYIMYHSSPMNSFGGQGGLCSTDTYESKWQLISETPKESVEKTLLKTKSLIVDSQKSKFSMLLTTNRSVATIQPTSSSEDVILRDIVSLGQVSSVETRATGNGQHELIILHRGPNIWTYDSFNNGFIYQNGAEYINTETVLHVNPVTGDVLTKWGRNMFILPHSITISYFMDSNITDDDVLRKDQQRRQKIGMPTSVWITDVALHQVFKFDWMKWDKPSLTLGIPGKPGNNKHQFCQPSDVSISSKGDIFVSDGYCNSRIVKFSSDGTYLTEWSALGLPNREYQDIVPHMSPSIIQNEWSSEIPYTDPNYMSNVKARALEFKVIHSLTIIPSEDGTLEQVCAADRENAAILCYTLDGRLIRRYSDSTLQPSVYAIQYDPIHKLIIGLTGRTDPSIVDPSMNNDNEWLSPNLFFLNPYKPSSLDELEKKEYNPYWADTYQGSALSGFFSVYNVRSPHDLILSTTCDIIYVSEINPNIVHRFQIQNDSDFTNLEQRDNPVKFINLANHHIWNLQQLTPYQLTGLSLLLFFVIIAIILGCIRLCWCGNRSSASIRRSKRESNKVFAIAPKVTANDTDSRWSFKRNSKKNKQAGFQPLLRSSDGPDYFAENELEDYVDEEEVTGDDVGFHNNDEDVLMDTYTDRLLFKQNNALNSKHKLTPKVRRNNAKILHSNSLSSRLFRSKTGINKSDLVA